jgi:SAM-dependent methyltransferase
MPTRQLASSRVAGDAPYPPLSLANRVGSLEEAQDPYEFYEDLGRRARADIERVLPAGWSFEGKTVLDFGCGAGRTLRHFLPEADTAEFWGCDIDAESIAWLEANLSPPLRVFENGPEPPLSVPDETFDLIWAVSVFTHLAVTWSSWLLDLRRVLKPGGLLVATFMGEGMSERIAGEEWDEDRVGMNVIRYGQSWDLGGPMVLHSPWWIREHWGRGFDVVELRPQGFATPAGHGQGIVTLQKNDAEVTREELERIDRTEPRETAALQHNLQLVQAEVADLRVAVDHFRGQADTLRKHVERFERSRSWQLTQPLRRVANSIRGMVGKRYGSDDPPPETPR